MDNKKTSSREHHVQLPQPPHPEKRREPLPSSLHPEEHSEHAVSERISAIMASPSYRRADQDIAYLNEDATRGLRLQLDFQKAEDQLSAHQIKHTIVVFGSTRIRDPKSVRQTIERLQTQLVAEPGNADVAQRLKIARQLLLKSRYYEVATEFTALVSNASKQLTEGQLVVMTGGGPGIMEAANRGAFDTGSKNIGLNINLPHEQLPNPYITPELCFRFRYFAVRKLHFLLRTRALVVFPGGYGTFDELFETLTLMQTRKLRPMPVVLVGETFWRQAFNVDFLVAEGVIDLEDKELFWYAETAEDIWDSICQWHRLNGTRLPCDCNEGNA